jgi:hypothetical protein
MNVRLTNEKIDWKIFPTGAVIVSKGKTRENTNVHQD